ncbi:MAG: hypothetical protein CMH84_00500 [Nocardioides sp.]|nr:hypothetical protein [Nocardioides sp.]
MRRTVRPDADASHVGLYLPSADRPINRADRGPWLTGRPAHPTLTTEAVIAWLDSGQPDPDHAATRIRAAVHGVIDAAAADTLSSG